MSYASIRADRLRVAAGVVSATNELICPVAARGADASTFCSTNRGETLLRTRFGRGPHETVADRFLVAAAQAHGGCVVTKGKERRGSAQLPNVCAHYKVKCINLEGFMNAKGIQYEG